MMNNIPPDVQNQIVQFQQLQQQLQLVAQQKQHISMQLDEVQTTIEAVGKVKVGEEVFKNVGSLLIKVTDLGEAKKDLKEKKETLEIKIKSLDRQESSLKDRYLTLQQDLTKALRHISPEGGVGAGKGKGDDESDTEE
jgi:prefoldin beta subunit